jgi:16S rRNA (guanine1516-N2)-methyltransferase
MTDLAELGFRLEKIPADPPEDFRLALRDLRDEKMAPLVVDFLSGEKVHRLKHGLSKNQPIAKAIGMKAGPRSVLDATAGLGVDAFFIAALGCRVRAIERSPIVFALLEDGYRRLQLDPELSSIAGRLSFEQGSAADLLLQLLQSKDPGSYPEVVYLDPMYPEEGRSKSALPKKGMQMFRRLIGDDDDAKQVLELALQIAQDRVVVKRPLSAPVLGYKPNHVFEGKTARFDMYLSASFRERK